MNSRTQEYGISGAGLAGGEWINAITDIKAMVERIPSETEADFLSIGQRLQTYYDQANSISAKSSTAAELLSGRGMVESMERMNGLLERINEYLKGFNSEMASNIEKFGAIIEMVEHGGGHLENFKGIAKELRALGITGKVFSASLGDRNGGFLNLSEDIKTLSEVIGRLSGTAGGDFRAMRSTLAEALTSTQKVHKQQQEGLSLIVRQIKTSLDALMSRHSVASTSLGSISTLFKETSRNIEDVVLSLQFHDITRQQLEKIGGALGRMGGMLGAGQEGSGVLDNDALAEDLITGCEQQSAELYSTRNKFAEALNNIFKSLEGISRKVSDMSDKSHMMIKSSGVDGTSIFEEVEDSLGMVKSSLKGVVEAADEISGTGSSVGRIAEKVSSLVGEIEEVSDDIDIIALNATVKTYQGGGANAGLRAIADSARKLSSKSYGVALDCTGILREIKSESDTLATSLMAELGESVTEIESAQKEMGDVLGVFHEINAQIKKLLSEIDSEAGALSDEISSLSSGAEAHEKVLESIDEAVSKLNVLSWNNRSRAKAGTNLPAPGLVRKNSEPADADGVLDGNGNGNGNGESHGEEGVSLGDDLLWGDFKHEESRA